MTTGSIKNVHAREVLDSRGLPTVEVEVTLADGAMGRAIVPAGASTGRAEAQELRDGDPQRYGGRGVRQAVAAIHSELGPAIVGRDATDQVSIDCRLIEINDPAPAGPRPRANAVLGVSLAVAHAAAASQGMPLFRHLNRVFNQIGCDVNGSSHKPTDPRLPLPMVNMISGGLHAGGNLDFQDFLIVPHAAADYPTSLEWTVRIYRKLGELLTAAGYEGRLVGDEGGFGPRLPSNRDAAHWIIRAIEAAALAPRDQIDLAIDVASSHFYVSPPAADRGSAQSATGYYRIGTGGDARLSSSQMIDQLEELVDEFPIASIEDGLAEEDWSGWQELTQRLGKRVTLIGDDLFATSAARLRQGISRGVANGVLIKVNQIGTLTETMQTMQIARSAGYKCVVSARSGETEDTTIADLAVGTAAEQIKIGSIVRSERLAKYNQLLRIMEQL